MPTSTFAAPTKTTVDAGGPPSGIPRIAYSIAESAEALGCSRQYVYDLINSGILPSVKVAGRRFIAVTALEGVIADPTLGSEGDDH